MIAIIGGGGKTTLLYALGNSLANSGKKVLLTTSTHIFPPNPLQAKVLLINPSEAQIKKTFLKNNLILASGPQENNKLTAPNINFWSFCKSCADFVIVEADGAKSRPFKAPAAHEPAIPQETDVVIGVAGVDALFSPISKCCHRPEEVAKILFEPINTILTPEKMARVILSCNGYQKNLPPKASFSLILNKCDTPDLLATAEDVCNCIRNYGGTFPVCFSKIDDPLLNLSQQD